MKTQNKNQWYVIKTSDQDNETLVDQMPDPNDTTIKFIMREAPNGDQHFYIKERNGHGWAQTTEEKAENFDPNFQQHRQQAHNEYQPRQYVDRSSFRNSLQRRHAQNKKSTYQEIY